MKQKIPNKLMVEVEGVDLTQVTDIEFWLRQSALEFTYTPTVDSATQMTVYIPYSDAVLLDASVCELQFGFTDSNETPGVSEKTVIPVGEVIKGAGYGS